MDILHRDNLQLGGFAGLKEHRLVVDNKAFKNSSNSAAWQGIGNFVYLADAKFDPLGETRLHNHKEVDVISVMINGRISHEGSLEHGQSLQAGQVQVQRAGAEGFSHNEINPDDTHNRMIQLWALPEKSGACADYKFYPLPKNGLSRIYGGSPDQEDTFSSNTLIDVGFLRATEQINLEQNFIMYITKGTGIANDEMVGDGDLLRGRSLQFEAKEDVMMIIIKQQHDT